MRYVIYILLFMNLGYFSWNMLQNMSRGSGVNHVRHGLPHVRRLETIQESAARSGSSSAESAGITEDDSPPAAGPVQDPESQPKRAEVMRVEALTESEPPGAIAPSSGCQVLGPFRSDKDMKVVDDRLNQLGYKPGQRTGEARVEVGYWVYLPAMEREEVLRITRLLDEKNDRDYLILKDNALSLGAYDSRSRADLRLNMLHKYGLDPVVEPRYATRTAYWLDLELPDRERAVLEKALGDYENVEAQETACQ